MKLFHSFAKKAPNRVFFSILLGAIAGISYSALIPLVLNSVANKDPRFPEINTAIETVFSFEVSQYKLALLFLIVCLIILITRTISEVILVRVATLVAKDFRVKFYDQISSAPIDALEKLGASRLIASINLDVPRIVMGARIFPSLLVSIISLFGMLGFLFFLNANVFKLVLLIIFIGIVIYQIPMMIGRKIFTHVRYVHDNLQESIRGLIFGAKELKLDESKKNEFFEKILLEQENDILKNEVKANRIVITTVNFGNLLSFIVIGLVIFIFVNYYNISQKELIGIVMTLLYIIGPIGTVLNALPSFMVANVSVRRVNQLLKEIPKERIVNEINPIPNWHSIKFNKVEYQYSSEGKNGFTIGPLNFEINKGEVTFITGANGSGKSTLSKLITLHYLPSAGHVSFDDEIITVESIKSYRQEICAIYSDYYLFDRLLGKSKVIELEIAQKYLQYLQLSEKVTINNGKFSTLALSDGQRKRLALLVAFLDDKPVYLFDEWAADQDPQFKNIFYLKILPELKNKGKAVIVISHDDRYFDRADKIIHMEQGRIISSE